MGDRAENKLTQVKIKSAGDGKLFDGGGLTLVKKGAGGKWVYRYSLLGVRREMGLGAWPTVSLSQARKERDRWRGEVAAGCDPIDTRRAVHLDYQETRDREDPTFSELVQQVFEARKATLRGAGVRGRWASPLDTHITPKIGRKRGSDLTADDIREALAPIWRTKHPTAIKAVRRTKTVLEDAELMGYPTDPAIVERARRILGAAKHTTKPTPSTPWQEIPALYAQLPGTISGLCLRFMILTLVRLDGCAGTRAAEIDGTTWTVPADRIKGLEGMVTDFRVPLSAAAQTLIMGQSEFFPDILFPGGTGRSITSRALEKALDKVGETGRPHGFRSSFRTWVQDTDACAWEVSEMVLGHKVGGIVERSYARSDLLERRRPVMEAWAKFVTGQGSAAVIPIRG